MPSFPNLPAELACQQALVRLFHRLDARDYEGVVAQFEPDALWIRQGQQLKGPEQMLKALQARSPTIHVHHILHAIEVERVDEARAKSTAYMTVYRTDTGKPPRFPLPMQRPDLVLVCAAEYRRNAEQWRLTRLSNTPTYSVAT